ncbi:MAG: 16S rRNA (uracil(1498)-N(3))-methyltransferase [Halomonas sp.]|jgi:16S rRNA (uracil1498-N3)-methyltransferase|uniref:Ribosomal RNA small subunit methyltransferase E n=1 Tax=Billgrantia tianxiuensis TaxID=2497861 RepID=A0A6I6SMW5_9GAMM|nr:MULTISPECIES: 16S rRNA (uracil(1498)-N(3))-methyltransferase [Halomonas]MCE8033496.1 16S rRNA (uracil(1498)-N(3))-methyltransferase [Halomonas sp. MCCC 1A11057]MDX5433769.1 16S rRNA (uracil(1498)-N(3))-methyltransferase [Halomonas sp.]MDX5503344.1 16S rRNA (uracil(1498)-N(3))-methyltransferase [Halomonas sp.]QHC49200.1 16S rRNA (uracil(1498)-N(3))-methyltransferase [Halomonas tianxiuensis]
MNLILLAPEEIHHDRLACLRDPRRLRHLKEVHRARVGDVLTLGVAGGGIGRGELTLLSDDEARFTFDGLDTPPPPPLPVHLVLALPRPRMLARSLEHVTAMGVKQVTLLHTRRVEKSYWQSPELDPVKIHEHLVLGLEQARDTVMPEVNLAKGFRPFIDERLPELLTQRRGLLAHPGMPQACPTGLTEPVTLLIGPEGGFIPYEVERMLEAGCEGIHLGPRILRVETAVVALLARLF